MIIEKIRKENYYFSFMDSPNVTTFCQRPITIIQMPEERLIKILFYLITQSKQLFLCDQTFFSVYN